MWRHPEHVRDAAKAVKWVEDHISDYGGDPDRIFVGGHSSGAYARLRMKAGEWSGIGAAGGMW